MDPRRFASHRISRSAWGGERRGQAGAPCAWNGYLVPATLKTLDGGCAVNASLKHELSLLDLIMASLGGIIGSGWLFGALYAANAAGPASILSWLLGGFAVILIGLVYAELAGMLPESGGVARYPDYSHGQVTGFLMGWAVWIGYAASPAIQAEAVVQYSAHYIPGLFSARTDTIGPWGLILAAGLMGAFFVINYFGVRSFARINTPLTLVKFIMPVLTIGVFLTVSLHWHNITAGHFAPYGTAGILQAIATSGIIFAFLGFRQAVDLAGEAKDPHRDVPRAIMIYSSRIIIDELPSGFDPLSVSI